MKDLDDDIRAIVEKKVDSVLLWPKETERDFASALRMQRIDPNLETVLSFLIGYLTGLVDGMYLHKHSRLPTHDEHNELHELLKRKAWEIEQAFMSTRTE